VQPARQASDATATRQAQQQQQLLPQLSSALLAWHLWLSGSQSSAAASSWNRNTHRLPLLLLLKGTRFAPR
jgi:hypothetical protein